MNDEARVECRTPNAEGSTRIPAWKFEAVRTVLLRLVPEAPAAVPSAPLKSSVSDALREELGADRLAELGSVGWHLTTVRLELQVRGELVVVPGVTPQQVQRPLA